MSISSPPRPVAVLDSAVTWTSDCLQLARSSPLDVPTPCADWDLGQLLTHMEDSLIAFEEAAEHGRVRDFALHTGKGPSVDRVLRLGCGMRAAWHVGGRCAAHSTERWSTKAPRCTKVPRWHSSRR